MTIKITKTEINLCDWVNRTEILKIKSTAEFHLISHHHL